ncbi:hypothetical protein [Pasteurella multocida]|uniref:hypothetical protein n=1 Tax=Pasteurella multocida TaxID=747 RepID=UPI00223CC8F2|nr:hypothetical protein [Pasteurella multocida]UZJ27359.1 hypothetical protein OO003_06935 [Pasteurella multocida]
MNKEIKELIDKIEQWVEDRDIFNGSTVKNRSKNLPKKLASYSVEITKITLI